MQISIPRYFVTEWFEALLTPLSPKIPYSVGLSLDLSVIHLKHRCHTWSLHFTLTSNPLYRKLFLNFWEIEDVSQIHSLTPEEEYCETDYQSSATRKEDGRFVVRLPFSKQELFPDSRDIAISRLLRSERRLARNPLLEIAYTDFMHQYLALFHMELAPPLPANNLNYYLPPQRCDNGFSLNDLLLLGPKLQSDLTMILTRWRFSQFVVVTDIVKMFRQIEVHPDDRDWQRLVWRDSSILPIQDYRACTVTYGTSCAPFLALRTLRQLAEDGRRQFPDASRILEQQVYVDDIFIGADSFPQAIQYRNQVIQLLDSAGMQLGKMLSNQPSLLKDLPSDDIVRLFQYSD